jgi:hypothetical protein
LGYLHLALPDSNGLDYDNIKAGGVHNNQCIGSCAGKPSHMSSCSHAADKNAWISASGLHPDSIAKNSAAGERAGRIDRNNSDLFSLSSIIFGEPIDQSAFARAWSACYTYRKASASEWKQLAKIWNRFSGTVFYNRKKSCDSSAVAGQNVLYYVLLWLREVVIFHSLP